MFRTIVTFFVSIIEKFVLLSPGKDSSFNAEADAFVIFVEWRNPRIFEVTRIVLLKSSLSYEAS